MTPYQRPLTGRVLNISISGDDDTAKHGFPEWQVNRVTLQVVATFVGQGASVAFGHDWRDDGVMQAVYGLVRQMQSPFPTPPDGLTGRDQALVDQPLLRNLLPWPDLPTLPAPDLERLHTALRVERIGLPTELRQVEDKARADGPDGPLYRYVRARALTFLRHRLGEVCDARLCVGGRRAGSQGRYPGILEEALLAVTARKPLYVSGLLGGAALQLVNALEEEAMPDDFCRPTEVTSLFQEPPLTEEDPMTLEDRTVNRGAVWNTFRETGPRGLAATNGLTVAENKELFRTPALSRVVELALVGLSRLSPGHD